MKTYIVLFGEAFVLTFFLTPIAIYCLNYLGLVDKPDGKRKFHPTPIPRLGGVVIVFAVSVTLCSLWFLPNPLGLLLQTNAPILFKIFPSVLLIFLVGTIDDIWPLTHWKKFTVQVLAATLVWLQNVSLELPFAIMPFEVGVFTEIISYLVTVGWIVGITNAINFIDGLDGLAVGVTLITSLTLLIAAIFSGVPAVIILLLPVCGALLGFLPYNFNPARIFLGDSGSTVLGFTLATMGIVYTMKTATLIAVLLPFVAFGLPLADLFLTIARRAIRGVPIFSSDHSHIHHRLLRPDISQRRVVLTLYYVCLTFSLLALSSLFLRGFTVALVITSFSLIVIIGTRILRYPEFQELTHFGKRFLLSTRNVRSHLALLDLCSELASATSLTEVASAMDKLTSLLCFDGYALQLGVSVDQNGRNMFNPPNAPPSIKHPDQLLFVSVPLGPTGLYTENENSLAFYRRIGSGKDDFQLSALSHHVLPALQQALKKIRPIPTDSDLESQSTLRLPTSEPC